jgi:colanic acid/amylovoran biosynthesis glycosyltransferase
VALVVHRFPEASEGFLVDHAAGLLAAGLDVHVVADRVDRSALAAVAPQLLDRAHACPAGRGRRGIGAMAAGVARRPWRATRHVVRSPGGVRARLAALARDLPLLTIAPDVVHTEFLTLARDRTHLPTALGCVLTSSIRGYDVAYAGLADPAWYDDVWAALGGVHVLGHDLWAEAQARGCPPGLPHALIPPAVDVDVLPEASPGGDGPLRLLSVGRLHWKKAHHHVLAALATLRAEGVDATLRIAGDGEQLEELAFARHQLGLDDVVTFLRALPREDVWRELADAHVLVHGAVSEGFGNAVLEAQGAGLPVVCTDAEGLAENVDPGVTGLVVPRRDPPALAAAIAELAADPERRVAMGRAGRRRVAAEFRPADQHQAFVAFFRDAVA